MRKDIWKILKDLENDKTTTNEAYHLLCDLFGVVDSADKNIDIDNEFDESEYHIQQELKARKSGMTSEQILNGEHFDIEFE